jgi:hypothetical protein
MFLPIFPTPQFFFAGERIRQLLSRERVPVNDHQRGRIQPG